jgi:phosphoserine phosphatase
MKQFDLDKWLVERYSALLLERIKKAHFNYDDVIEILNAALRQPPVVGRSEQLPTNIEVGKMVSDLANLADDEIER